MNDRRFARILRYRARGTPDDFADWYYAYLGRDFRWCAAVDRHDTPVRYGLCAYPDTPGERFLQDILEGTDALQIDLRNDRELLMRERTDLYEHRFRMPALVRFLQEHAAVHAYLSSTNECPCVVTFSTQAPDRRAYLPTSPFALRVWSDAEPYEVNGHDWESSRSELQATRPSSQRAASRTLLLR